MLNRLSARWGTECPKPEAEAMELELCEIFME